jgi:SAM-dependent methyltransferase
VTGSCDGCGAAAVRQLASFAALPRVSSDCRPIAEGGALACCERCGLVQKPVTAAFLAEIAAIYSAYDVYYQGGGAEQMVFDAFHGGARRRSEVLTERIRAAVALPASGRVLDIGCGNGVFLRSLGAGLPDWDLFGLELDDRNLPALARIPRFAGLVGDDLYAVRGQYGLVTMLHALEHLTEPLRALESLRRCVPADGLLFIQVPNLAANPFDLIIADHASHFTPCSLEGLLLRAGWDVLLLETGWVPKEISVLVRPALGSAGTPTQPVDAPGLAAHHLGWLAATLGAAHGAAGQQPFGIFGTSIAGTWLAGALGDRIGFHVDEDTSRIGRQFFGKPVVAPGAEPDGATVFLGLAPAVAAALATRLARPRLRLVRPPPLGDFGP